VVSAFLHYSKEVRETIRSTSDFAKKSGESWKTLPEDKKQKYRIKEQKDKERSLKEKEEWKQLKHQQQQYLKKTTTPIKTTNFNK